MSECIHACVMCLFGGFLSAEGEGKKADAAFFFQRTPNVVGWWFAFWRRGEGIGMRC